MIYARLDLDPVPQSVHAATRAILAATLQRDLVIPFVDLNFGPQPVYPRLTMPVREPEDITALADALAKLVPLGNLGIQASVVRDRLGFPDPEDGADLLGQPAAPALQRAANRQSAPVDTVSRQVERLASKAQPGIDAWIDRVRQWLDQAVAEGQSLDVFAGQLLSAFPEMDLQEVAQVMAEAMTASNLAGRYEADRG